MPNKAARLEHLFSIPVLFCSDDASHCDLGTPQIRGVQCSSMGASGHASKDGCIKEAVTFLFQGWIIVVTLVNKLQFLTVISELNRRFSAIYFVNITTRTILEFIIFFPCLLIFKRLNTKEDLTVSQDYRAGTLLCSCVQHFLKAWKYLFSRSLLTDFF